MPELPDVELQRRYVNRFARGRRVRSAELDRPEQLLERVRESTLKRRLKGRVLARIDRHGKVLFLELDGDGALVLHFGMTGFLKKYSSPKDAPDHPRLVLTLDDGSCLAFACQRLLGTIGWVDDPADWIREHDLGPDLLEIGESDFLERLRGRRGSIKSALMDQTLFAGCGNVYSDEILFQARLHPKAQVSHLTSDRVKELHRTARRVLKEAVRHRADPGRMPDDWLLPHRDADGRCPECGDALRRIKVSQRSAWVCEHCQMKS